MVKRNFVKRTEPGVPLGNFQNRSAIAPPLVPSGNQRYALGDGWAVKEGNLHVIKVPASVSSMLKKEVYDSFVATSVRSDVTKGDIEGWLTHQMGAAVEVKQLTYSLFWVKPLSGAEYQRLLLSETSFCNALIRRLDRWTEVLGPSLQPCWIRCEGIPLHAWSEEVFRRIGDCLGQVVAVDEAATLKRRVNILRLQALIDQRRSIPRSVALDVEGVRFFVQITVETC